LYNAKSRALNMFPVKTFLYKTIYKIYINIYRYINIYKQIYLYIKYVRICSYTLLFCEITA